MFSYIGFESLKVTVSNEDVNYVILNENVSILNEVIIEGYGKQLRATLLTSVSKLDRQILEPSAKSNTVTTSQRKINGLRGRNKTGQPGSVPKTDLCCGTKFGVYVPLIMEEGI